MSCRLDDVVEDTEIVDDLSNDDDFMTEATEITYDVQEQSTWDQLLEDMHHRYFSIVRHDGRPDNWPARVTLYCGFSEQIDEYVCIAMHKELEKPIPMPDIDPSSAVDIDPRMPMAEKVMRRVLHESAK